MEHVKAEESGVLEGEKMPSNATASSEVTGDLPMAETSNGAGGGGDGSISTVTQATDVKFASSSCIHPAVTTWQWLFSSSDMQHTPSFVHTGMPQEQEKYLRWKGIQLIFRIGEYMRVGNHVTCTASIFFHRFFMRRAFVKDARERGIDSFTFQEIAPTAIFLACKVEEYHRKLHGVIQATMAVLDRSPAGIEAAETRTFEPDEKSDEYRRWKDAILLYEERLLETLCFDLIVEQPHPVAIKACKELDTKRDMAQLTVILLNILLHGPVCTFYDAATLAAAAFQKACQLVDIDPSTFEANLSSSRSWYDVFDVDKEEVDEAMQDVDEQITYHNERLSSMRSSQTSLTGSSTPTTHHHKTAYTMNGTATEKVAALNGTTDPQQVQFASQAEVIEMRNNHLQDEAMNVVTAQPTPLPPLAADTLTDHGSANELKVTLEKVDRTDPSRPISRHGGKGADLRPPPPLAMPPKDSEEKKIRSNEVHEETIAQKIMHEQREQEGAATSESEEEGAW